MQIAARLIIGVTFFCGVLSAAETARYFKEDHYTGAMYIALHPDARYVVTAREHMFVAVEQSGRWSKSGPRITFTPDKSGMPLYSATQVTHRGYTFLALEGDSGPSIAVPIEETKHDLDENPKVVPPYVFFEISATVYARETKLTYPFRTRPKAP